jgi:hypothetical protein
MDLTNNGGLDEYCHFMGNIFIKESSMPRGINLKKGID